MRKDLLFTTHFTDMITQTFLLGGNITNNKASEGVLTSIAVFRSFKDNAKCRTENITCGHPVNKYVTNPTLYFPRVIQMFMQIST